MAGSQIWQIVWAGVGSLGFCWLFNVRRDRISFVVVGAMVTWLLYLLAEAVGWNGFTCSLAATVFATIFSEALAHALKAPVTAFLMPVLIPMIPGGSLYNTVYHLLVRDTAQMRHYANATVMTCMGIVLGIVCVQFVVQYWKGRKKRAA